MATKVSDPMRYVVDQIENHCGYNSAVLSGIVPDRRHLDQGGFHCSIEDLIRYGNQRDYSNTRPNDKGFNPQYGAAFDMSMSTSDMKKAYGRYKKVWDDKSDPRRQYLNCINGWDGSGDASRMDFDANVIGYASPDHKWHVHGEIHRRWLLLMKAAHAVVSTFKGETKEQWFARYPEDRPKPTTPPTPPKPVPADWTNAMITNAPTLNKGAEGKWVRTYQGLLCVRGLVPEAQWADFVDGDWGDKTEAASKAAKVKYGLENRAGTADAEAWAALFTASDVL